MPVQIKAKLIKREVLKSNIFKFSLYAKEIVENAKPGQFIEIRVTDGFEPFLRRPISIYNMEKETGILEIIFRTQGKGTIILSKKQEGDFIDIIGPLGYGNFKFEEYNNIVLLGGGIGIFPLYQLAKEAINTKNINTYLGFKDKDAVILEEEFKNVSNKLVITTDDGSYGVKGYAIDELEKDLKEENIDAIFACGPSIMLKKVQELSIQNNIPCQISLEEKMGCGIGACLGCAVKIISSETPYYAHVCKMGPVFYAEEVEI